MARIRLKTFDDRYVIAIGGGGGEVRGDSGNAGDHELFTLNDTNGGVLQDLDEVSLRAFDGRHFLCAEGGGDDVVVANRTAIGEWERFRVGAVGDTIIGSNPFALQAANGSLLTVANDGRLAAGARSFGEREHFRIELVATLPLGGYQQTRIGRGRWMETWVTVPAGGKARIRTHTWNRNEAHGFTGGLLVLFLDDGSNVLDAFSESYGVDGTGVAFLLGFIEKKASRWDNRELQLAADAIAKVSAVQVYHFHDPHNRLLPIIQEVKDAAELIGATVNDVRIFLTKLCLEKNICIGQKMPSEPGGPIPTPGGGGPIYT